MKRVAWGDGCTGWKDINLNNGKGTFENIFL